VCPAEVHKAQELVYELQIGQLMTRRLITAAPEMTMRQVKALLRDNRISGLPVLLDGELAGIVSIEDLILALERGELDVPIERVMTCNVQTIRESELAVRALSVFARAGVGRLPVLDADSRLVGIVTPGDITRGVLEALQHAYEDEEIRRYRASHVFDDIRSDHTSLVLRYEVLVGDFARAGRASSQLKSTLNRLGVDPRIVRRVAIISYESEMNIVIHSTTGGELVVEVAPEMITLVAHDGGPGIPDVEKAMQPGFSTAPDWIREMGFGAGMGLSNINACADAMHLISSASDGTRLEAAVQLKPPTEKASHETAGNR